MCKQANTHTHKSGDQKDVCSLDITITAHAFDSLSNVCLKKKNDSNKTQT